MVRIARDQAVAASPRLRMSTRGMRQRAWWVIRRREVFTLPELLSVLAENVKGDQSSNLRKYVTALARAGYLKVDETPAPGTSLTSNGFHRYHLKRNNGRLAPVYRQSKAEVYDPNTEEVFVLGERGDSDA